MLCDTKQVIYPDFINYKCQNYHIIFLSDAQKKVRSVIKTKENT